MARIEAALSRVEKAAADLPAQPAATDEMEQRYERLRERVRDGIEELDTIIVRLEQ